MFGNMYESDCKKISTNKSRRVLEIYAKLLGGKTVNKQELSVEYNVNERTIQRDFEAIRDFLDRKTMETGMINYLIYDRDSNGYHLE